MEERVGSPPCLPSLSSPAFHLSKWLYSLPLKPDGSKKEDEEEEVRDSFQNTPATPIEREGESERGSWSRRKEAHNVVTEIEERRRMSACVWQRRKTISSFLILTQAQINTERITDTQMKTQWMKRVDDYEQEEKASFSLSWNPVCISVSQVKDVLSPSVVMLLPVLSFSHSSTFSIVLSIFISGKSHSFPSLLLGHTLFVYSFSFPHKTHHSPNGEMIDHTHSRDSITS